MSIVLAAGQAVHLARRVRESEPALACVVDLDSVVVLRTTQDVPRIQNGRTRHRYKDEFTS